MLTAMTVEPWALWQAQRGHTALAGQPLIAVSRQRVAHLNAEARQLGVERGMAQDTAQQFAPALVAVPAASPALQDAWEALLLELSGLSPWLEPLAEGRALLRLPPPDAGEVARHYGARVGVSRYREVALLAALAAHPGNARHVALGDEAAFLGRLPVHFLCGVGLSRGGLQKLRYLGITTVGELRAWRAAQLSAFLGREALALVPFVLGPWGESVRRYVLPATLAARHDFEEPAHEPAEWESVLHLLAVTLSARLAGRVARNVSVEAESVGLRMSATRLAKAPLAAAPAIYRHAALALADTDAPALGVSALTLRLSSLSRPAAQEALWPARAARQKAVEAVVRRFPDALLQIEPLNPYAHAREQQYVLTRVAQGDEVEVSDEATAPADRGAGERGGQPADGVVSEQPA